MRDLITDGGEAGGRGSRSAETPPAHLTPGRASESGLDFTPDPLSQHADAVYALFEEPDFHYGSPHPDLLSEPQIDELVGRDAYGILHGSELVGLYSAIVMGDEKEGHYWLQLRLTSRTPVELGVAAYHAAIRRTRLAHDTIRINAWVGGHDPWGLSVLRASDLVEEGFIANEVMYHSRHYPEYSFALIWYPREVTE